ncbi:hypothetical protein CASFOL_034012 [Castilleja foliolosa]|uniref:Pectinesterase inhibitor domain-containing protein n=1 Tax=Castilleja foliolosa TaxID=1961234 RepID=A0ABD3C0A1_9LAMI
MASYKQNLLILFTLFITLAMSPTLLRADVASDLCGRTTHKPLCLTIVNQDRRADLKTSPNGIAKILLDRAVDTTIAAMSKIDKLLPEPTNKRLRESLLKCNTDYFETINTLTTANLKEINRQTYPTLVNVIRTGIDKPSDCESSFHKLPAVSSPVTMENYGIKEDSATTLEVISLVVCNKPSSC